MSRWIPKSVLPGYLLLCLLLGGSSVANWGNVSLQLLALPLIFWTLVAKAPPEIARRGRVLTAIIWGLLLMIALQLCPLPPAVWTMLPGRESVARSYELMGEPLPWLPLSLAPYQTLASAMWLLPPIAVLLAVVRRETDSSFASVWILIGVTIAAVLLGTIQVSYGPRGYLYAFTNWGLMTGFFANSNHMATLLLVTIPFVAALVALRASRSTPARPSFARTVIAVLAFVFLLIGLAMTKSLAAVGLAPPVIGASLMMIWPGRGKVLRWWLLIFALGASSSALVLSPRFGNDLTQAQSATYQITRYYSWPRTFAAALDFAPVGSGIGTFVNVYPRYEDPAQVEMTYTNHAHNEYLEIALETGVPGLALLAVFALWWVRRASSIWRVCGKHDVFAQAGTVASAAILLHSIVDYPIRTTAIAAVFALSCGLMATERGRMRN